MTGMARRNAVLLLAVAAGACASPRVAPTAAEKTPCPEVAGNPVERVCREDAAVETLQARFRATVEVDGAPQISDGVLLVRRPDAVRVKLFGLGGMTVHDATWVGDESAVRGLIRRPLSGEPLALELRSGEGVSEPEAELSLALWALWRPRCARPPTSLATEPGWLRLDPDTAHAMARDVRVGTLGVDEERIVRAGAVGAEEIQVLYRARDCSLDARLPTEIDMVSRSRRWSAKIEILSQRVNLDLDDALFALPGSGSVAP